MYLSVWLGHFIGFGLAKQDSVDYFIDHFKFSFQMRYRFDVTTVWSTSNLCLTQIDFCPLFCETPECFIASLTDTIQSSIRCACHLHNVINRLAIVYYPFVWTAWCVFDERLALNIYI